MARVASSASSARGRTFTAGGDGVTTERCRHCHFGIPSDATLCPGCGRRHEPLGQATRLPRHSGLLRRARWARRLLVVTGWVAAAFGLVALSRYVVGLDRVTPRLDGDVPRRVTDLAQQLALATLIAMGLAAGGTWAWASRVHRNLRGLELEPDRWSPWSLLGWIVPGRAALRRKMGVDAEWRDRSPLVAALPASASGWSRRPVSRVVLRWWALWLWAPAAVVLVATAVDAGAGGAPALGGDLPLLGVAAAALVVATVRALYDVVGIITVAQAHRAETILRRRAELPWFEPADASDPGDPTEVTDAEVAVAADLPEHAESVAT
jgi:hypothetical protein